MAALTAIGLILNNLDVQISTPAEIIPGCTLRRPTESELVRFRERLSNNNDTTNLVMLASEYDPPKGTNEYRPLDPSMWRYWVVEECSNSNVIGEGLWSVAKITRLCSVELPCYNLTIFPGLSEKVSGVGRKMGVDPFIYYGLPTKLGRFDEDVLDQIREAWQLFSGLDSRYAAITAAVEMYGRLGPAKHGIPFSSFGVFAVVESILTHDPHGTFDSLTHQIVTKMMLLNRRFSVPLDYSSFNSSDGDAIWKKLYSYRSCVAHGKKPDFNKDLKLLKDEETAVKFLDNAAKTLLRHALKEPQLVLDLQTC